MKKITIVVLALMLLIVPSIVYAAFSDVPEDHWAASYINELSGKGVINGFPDGTFGPSDTLTTGQFLKLIITASFPSDTNFNRVKPDFDHWAARYVKVAENYDAIEEGSITIDNIDLPISRIDVVKILGVCDIEMRLHNQKSVETLGFSDLDSVSLDEQLLLSHAVASGIIGGYPDGTFRPKNNLTRAEASKILSVYMSIDK